MGGIIMSSRSWSPARLPVRPITATQQLMFLCSEPGLAVTISALFPGPGIVTGRQSPQHTGSPCLGQPGQDEEALGS